jgi:molybdate transport system ATP-binding protein
MVTHDPLDAMTLADAIVILEAGCITQAGSPAEISARPRSRYVSDLVGVNLFEGVARDDRVMLDRGASLIATSAGTGPVFAVVHPRAISLHRDRPEGTPRNVWAGVVQSLDFEGDRVRIQLGGPLAIVAEVTPAAVAELGLVPGQDVWASVKASEVTVYPA